MRKRLAIILERIGWAFAFAFLSLARWVDPDNSK